MTEIGVLFDGWPLVYAPNSPSALHLLALLAYQPENSAARVALPGEPAFPLPGGIEVKITPVANHSKARLRWEQRTLIQIGQEEGASLLHLTTGFPALFSKQPCLLSPAGFQQASRAGKEPAGSHPPGPRRGLAERLRLAMAQGGQSRLAGVIWPDDLPAPSLDARLFSLPPIVHPAFLSPANRVGDFGSYELTTAGLGLPDGYVLYCGPHHPFALRQVLNAWSWAAGAIGDSTPLLLVGLSPEEQQDTADLLKEYNLEETVLSLPPLPPESLAFVMQNCAVLFQPGDLSPWGGSIRLALAAGKPVVAVESPATDVLLGPAAYLVPADKDGGFDSRSLGAALITVVVEESVAESLSSAARQRSANWQPEVFRRRLGEVYRQIAPD